VSAACWPGFIACGSLPAAVWVRGCAVRLRGVQPRRWFHIPGAVAESAKLCGWYGPCSAARYSSLVRCRTDFRHQTTLFPSRCIEAASLFWSVSDSYSFRLMIWCQAKPSQNVNWGRKLARSASRRPLVCMPFLHLTLSLDSITDTLTLTWEYANDSEVRLRALTGFAED